MRQQKVIARIEGGLGNQLFQYAAARSLADRLSCELALDLRGLAENGDRPFQLDLYRIRAHVAAPEDLAGLPHWHSTRLGRIRSRLSQWMPGVFSFPVFWPDSFAFDSRFEQIRHPVFLVGYWQTEKYFSWNRERLLQDVRLVNAPGRQPPILDQILATQSVALHVRRGDYVTNSAAAQFHGLCDMAYYQSAVAALKSQFSDLHVFIFSDEPQWAKDNLRFDVPVHVVDENSADQGHLDLELMRHCRHHVIANSSFSWWGAWLSEGIGQLVYAPRRWFKDPGFDTSDVIPARWRLLD